MNDLAQAHPKKTSSLITGQLNGMLLLDKAAGRSSAQVLNQMKAIMVKSGLRRRELPKLGHGGTLDPFASGLLVVLVGHGVSFSEDHLGGDKRYRGTMRIGFKSSTGDPEGDLIQSSDHRPSLEDWSDTAKSFLGETYFQVPPMHSAKKRQGKPLYKLARSGIEIEREPLPCEIKSVRCLALSDDRLDFEVCCSAGTFIRVFAEDWAMRTNTLAHLEGLRRLQSKDKTIENAVDMSALVEQLQMRQCWSELDAFIPLQNMVGDRPLVHLTKTEAVDVSFGRKSPLRKVEGTIESQVALTYDNKILALAEQKSGVWGYRKVFIAP